MRPRISRQLEPMLAADGAEARAVAPAAERIPPEFNGREYVRFLLYVAATIEHSLMVQYLFAAYSLGGPDVPAARQAEVRAWQETILGIAKEEMGHLVTVQNLLKAVGAPLNFDREDYPYDSPFYPFGFKLQPLGRETLAAYIVAESPEDWGDEPDEADVKALAEQAGGGPVNRVGQLYADLLELMRDEELVPDDAFDANTAPFQASFGEWGRGYREGQRGVEASSDLGLPTPELLILRVRSRADAIAALEQVGEQGEGLETPADENESHFRRFLAIYRGLTALDDAERKAVVRRVGTNPTTDPAEQDGSPSDPSTGSSILNPVAKLWAHLFNLRYRKLLIDVTHAFQLADDPRGQATLSPRGALIHRTFQEMYNLRAIAGLLVALPLDENDPDGPRAGPPFQMPYTLKLPAADTDRWQLHRDVLDTCAALIAELVPDTSGDGRDYLAALAQADDIERAQLDLLIAGSALPVAVNGGTPG